MPKARWGISASVVEDFDRASQFTPYAGPIPPNGVYEWLITQLKYVPETSEKCAQMRLGLELAPRVDRKGESKYDGYSIMVFMPVTEKSAFRYVPFLDAIGVSGRDFETRTIVDNDGNIKSIGKWRQDGEQYVAAELRDNKGEQAEKYPKDIGAIMPLIVEGETGDDESYDSEYDNEDTSYGDDDADDDSGF